MTPSPAPSAGDIWCWDYEDTQTNVLLIEHLYADCWLCYTLDADEYYEWFFGEEDMPYWRKLA